MHLEIDVIDCITNTNSLLNTFPNPPHNRQMELRLDSSIHQQILRYRVLAIKEAKAVVAVVKKARQQRAKYAKSIEIKNYLLKLIKGTFSPKKKEKFKKKCRKKSHDNFVKKFKYSE